MLKLLKWTQAVSRPESLPNLQATESESQLLQDMREAVKTSDNKILKLREFGNRILTFNYSADAFIEAGLQVLCEAVYDANSEQERQQETKNVENWIRLFQLPKSVVEKVTRKVQDSKVKDFVLQKPTQLQQTTTLQSPITTQQEITTQQAALATRPTSDIVHYEKDIIKVDLDRQCSDLEVLKQLSYSIQWVFNTLSFQTVEPVLDETGTPLVVVHLRVIRFVFQCKLKDMARFRAMSSESVQMGLQYLGIPKPAIVPGLRGIFEIQVPKPQSFWGYCPFSSLLEYDAQRRVLMADPSQPPKFPIGVDLQNNKIFCSLAQPVLYAGITRSGKSNFARQTLLQICLKYDPSWVSIIAIDLRLKSFAPFQGLPHFWNGEVVTTVEKAYRALRSVMDEYATRDRIFAEAGVDNIWSYNKKQLEKNLPPMPVWFVWIEEIDTLKYRQSKPFIKELDDLLEEGTRTTSSNGILWAIGAHTPTEESITTDVRDMCATRVVLHCTPHASMFVFDEKNSNGQIGAQLVGEGDSWVYYFGRPPVRTQIGFLNQTLLEKTVKELKTLYAGVKPTITSDVSKLEVKPTVQQQKLPAPQQAAEQIVRKLTNIK